METCIERDKHRKRVYGERAAREVHGLVSKFDYGISINCEGTPNKVVKKIIQSDGAKLLASASR